MEDLRTGSGGTVFIRVANIHTFPCVYVEGVIESDGEWMADDMTQDRALVGTYGRFDSPYETPEIFPFSYEEMKPVKQKPVNEGILFDFGKETFAKIHIDLPQKQEPVLVSLGESEEEALDTERSVIHFKEIPVNGVLQYPPYAFRYIYVREKEPEVCADYEYLPIPVRGKFHCSDEQINQIYSTAVRTFSLNCREFILDGIKRDRWVWAGDAYQSLFVNHYLFSEPEIEKRTLIALGGKKPVKEHINTIMDYTFFWIMGCMEYYKTYGDILFLEQIFPQMKEFMDFCLKRTDADGFMRPKDGDWIFIDWGEMDKTGALCAEQVLYAKALRDYAEICRLLGRAFQEYFERSLCLAENIKRKFYDIESEAFIDSFESGRHFISRQSNVMAYLFLPCDTAQKKKIYKNVILNEKRKPITTPYFKFYETLVCLAEEKRDKLEQELREYYGGMLKEGATTFFEEYDPGKKGKEHYAMYGNPYEKSLCHAWSANPVFLLGRYRLGVKNTGIAYDKFEVEPRLGDLEYVAGTVPLPTGDIEIFADKRHVEVFTDVPGGELLFGGKRIPIQPGKRINLTV